MISADGRLAARRFCFLPWSERQRSFCTGYAPSDHNPLLVEFSPGKPDK